MTGVNWDLLRPTDGGFANALADGMDMGARGRQLQERKEYRSALGVLATEPENQEALSTVFSHNHAL